jgi:hypothetical protein
MELTKEQVPGAEARSGDHETPQGLHRRV